MWKVLRLFMLFVTLLFSVVLFSAPTRAKVDKLIESQINGEFNGFHHGNVYKLLDGTVWRQIEQKDYYYYNYMPRVAIFDIDGYFCLKLLDLKGDESAIWVERLR